jgi:tripartite-type tricarboxylate transporter receptor subunit TctC
MKLVVPFPAGGVSDVLARSLAAKMSEVAGQPMIVENRPGAGTTIAADSVAKSAPDGYTLLLQDTVTHAITAALYPKLPYDPVKDFTPITIVANTALMLVVHPSSPAKNVEELIAWIKSTPGQLSYGSSGNGTIIHLASEMFKNSAALDIQHVPYKGSGPATQAIVAGEVAFVFSSMPPALTNAKAGRLRALAVTTPRRASAAPEVPTMVESGMKDFVLVVNTSIFAPGNMPAPLVARLHRLLQQAMGSPDMARAYDAMGAEPASVTPDELKRIVVDDLRRMAPVVKASGARVE